MNILIFCLTTLAVYAILSRSYKAWNHADVEDKMTEIIDLEKVSSDIKTFKKSHKGSAEKKRQIINKFKQE